VSAVHILTTHGTLVCRDTATERLVHRALHQIDERCPPAVATMVAGSSRERGVALRINDSDFLFAVATVPGQRPVNLAANGRFLCATPQDERLVCDRPKAQEWEQFLLITAEDLRHLRFILGNQWLIRSSRRICEAGAVALRPGFALWCGDLILDLCENLPLRISRTTAADPDDTPFLSAWVVRDRWKLDEILLYRPLVFYVAFGAEEYFEQVTWSMESLRRFGNYDGNTLLITNESDEYAHGFVPASLLSGFAVHRCAAGDAIDFNAARYRIIDWPDGARFQPLLYVDGDVAFNADVRPMMAALALTDRISAIRESGHLATEASLGSVLLREDGCDPGDARGFNAGQLGIPNLAKAGDVLRLILDSVTTLRRLGYVTPHNWFDQPVANYVAFKLGGFDLETLSRFGTVGRAGMERDASHRTGLVHFWPAGRAKCQVMQTYIATLAKAAALG
jgi:hypothetical protein